MSLKLKTFKNGLRSVSQSCLLILTSPALTVVHTTERGKPQNPDQTDLRRTPNSSTSSFSHSPRTDCGLTLGQDVLKIHRLE